MIDVPTGTVTFLFTDIEGSTRLAPDYPGAWEAVREQHHAILRQASEVHGGNVFQIVGHALHVVFPTAPVCLILTLGRDSTETGR